MFIICIALRIIGLSSEMEGKPFAMLMLFNKYLIVFLGVMIIYYIADMFNKTRTNRLIRYIGDYSFDVYLVHNPYCVALSAIVLNKMMGYIGIHKRNCSYSYWYSFTNGSKQIYHPEDKAIGCCHDRESIMRRNHHGICRIRTGRKASL